MVTQPNIARGIKIQYTVLNQILKPGNNLVSGPVHTASIRIIKQCVSDFECN